MIGPPESPTPAAAPIDPVIASAIQSILHIASIHGLPVVVWHKGAVHPLANTMSHEQLAAIVSGCSINTEQIAAYTLQRVMHMQDTLNALAAAVEAHIAAK
jgi:hypothetical protein